MAHLVMSGGSMQVKLVNHEVAGNCMKWRHEHYVQLNGLYDTVYNPIPCFWCLSRVI